MVVSWAASAFGGPFWGAAAAKADAVTCSTRACRGTWGRRQAMQLHSAQMHWGHGLGWLHRVEKLQVRVQGMHNPVLNMASNNFLALALDPEIQVILLKPSDSI